MSLDKLPFEYRPKEFWEFYCPICKTLRRSFYWPSPRPKHYFSLFILALVLTMAFWPWFNWKGIFLILPFWALFEFYYRSRARQSLICPHCGFDPYLYKFDVKLARKRVEHFWAEKKQAREKLKNQKTESSNPGEES